ncbi:MAG: hypothetical protein ACRCXT_05485 [Paraclostridium sp.]
MSKHKYTIKEIISQLQQISKDAESLIGYVESIEDECEDEE